MNMKYEYWFASLTGLSSREKIALREMLGNGEEIYRLTEYGMEELHMIPQKVRQALKDTGKDRNWERSWEAFCRTDIRLVYWEHKDYPQRLMNIYNPPYCLFVKGRLPSEEQRNVAVVGARSCSPYGQAVAEKIGKELARHGVGTISGLALGIDGAVHRGSVAGGGPTYGIMGCGVDVCYPPGNRSLYQQVQECGGILSEFACGSPPGKVTFPMRNRIISGLADAVIVVEARKRSGSLITADYALDQGKAVYAVPGRIDDDLSYGTNWLLSQGAAPFYDLTEFLKDMGVIGKKKSDNKIIMNFLLEKNERLVYSVLDFTPKHFETVIAQAKLSFAEVVSALSSLECNGWVKEIYKNYYVKTGL